MIPFSFGKVVGMSLACVVSGCPLHAVSAIGAAVVGEGLKLSCSRVHFVSSQVCQRVAELYPKNYYAWTQRSWVVLRAVGGARADAGAGPQGLPGEDTPTAPAAAELVSMAVIGDTPRCICVTRASSKNHVQSTPRDRTALR